MGLVRVKLLQNLPTYKSLCGHSFHFSWVKTQAGTTWPYGKWMVNFIRHCTKPPKVTPYIPCLGQSSHFSNKPWFLFSTKQNLEIRVGYGHAHGCGQWPCQQALLPVGHFRKRWIPVPALQGTRHPGLCAANTGVTPQSLRNTYTP